MRVFYCKNGITIFCGDCRAILPRLPKPEVVITDPVWPNVPKDLLTGGEDPFGLFVEAVKAMRVLPKRFVVVLRNDSDPRFLTALPPELPFFRCQILSYVIPGFIGRKLGGDEIAYGFGKPIKSRPGLHLIPGWAPKAQPNHRKANGHPCSRALIHFEFLIRCWVEENDLVLDPFMGSGTTLVAARKAGRQAIGIEIEQKYCRIAAERLEELR